MPRRDMRRSRGHNETPAFFNDLVALIQKSYSFLDIKALQKWLAYPKAYPSSLQQ